MKPAMCVAAAMVLLASLAGAADEPEKVSTRNYALKPLFKTLYPANAGVEDRPMRGPDEPIGFVKKPTRDDESTVYIGHLITVHIDQSGWKGSGGTSGEIVQAVGEVIEIRAPDARHESVERFLNALAKPVKFNPKATADELTAAAVYVSQEQGTITQVYGLAPFPARVCGENVTNRTSRVQVISALMERIYDNVSPGKWQNKGHDVGAISEIGGRIVVTAPAETHVELARKMQEWTKR